MDITNKADLLVIGIGNPLMADDGIGLRILEELSKSPGDYPYDTVEFLDGGTQGIALLGRISGRRAVVFLDAVSMNSPPGRVHVLLKQQLLSFQSKISSAHEGSASEILKTTLLTDDLPETAICIGIEPKILKTSIGFSPEVEDAVDNAVTTARNEILKIISSWQ